MNHQLRQPGNLWGLKILMVLAPPGKAGQSVFHLQQDRSCSPSSGTESLLLLSPGRISWTLWPESQYTGVPGSDHMTLGWSVVGNTAPVCS